MKHTFKNFAKVSVFVVIAIGVIGWLVNQHMEKVKKERAQKELRMITASNITTMVSKWHAIDDWQGIINKKSESLENIYTADIQEALIRDDKRPILAVLPILDVVKQGDESYLAYFDEPWPVGPNILFVLKVSRKQYEQIVNRTITDYYSDNFAFIALVHEVLPPESPVADAMLRDFIYTAIGECLDIMYVGIYNKNDKID